ncbi:MAG: hypothetical protein ACRDGN_05145, partial [bacterium]
ELLSGLEGEKLTAAEAAIIEVHDSGIVGDFSGLMRAYKAAIRRALDPNRKTMVGHIDRGVVKNPQLAAVIDRELADVTKDELARANAAMREILTASKAVQIIGAPQTERQAVHDPSAICQAAGEHPTSACGYFKDPVEWMEVFVLVVREAIAAAEVAGGR